MSLRRTVAVALLAAVAVLAMSGLSAAAGQRTSIVVSLKFPAFHGTLKSTAACLGSRKVTMYRKSGGKTKKLGADTSAASGKWKVAVGKNLTSGEYFATVAKKGVCLAARSKTLTID